MRRQYLVASMTVGLIFLCLGTADLQAAVQLSFGMRASSPERFPVYDAWAERFCQRNPGVQMEVLKVAGNLYETYLVRIAAGTPVDVMWGWVWIF